MVKGATQHICSSTVSASPHRSTALFFRQPLLVVRSASPAACSDRVHRILVASSSKPRSYAASNTAIRSPGAVARPLSSPDATTPAEATQTAATPASAGAWASASESRWNDFSEWDDVSDVAEPVPVDSTATAATSGAGMVQLTDQGDVNMMAAAVAEMASGVQIELSDDDPCDPQLQSSDGGSFFSMPAVPQDVLTEFEEKLEADVQTVIVTLTAILGVIIFWRGVWALLDHFVGDSVFGDICCALVGLFIVLYIRLSGLRIAAFWPPS